MPLLDDPVVARIAPFAVLLLSSLLAGAMFTRPDSGYPLRVLAMGGAVFLFWKAYRAEICKVDPLPPLAGALVAAVWLAVRAGGDPVSASGLIGPMSHGLLIAWACFRVFGTVALVPYIEEMFFRGYLLHRLNFGGAAGKLTALALTSLLFGSLHDTIWLASASGVVFGLLALRREKVFDAVVAHASANALIAAWAVSTGDWSVI